MENSTCFYCQHSQTDIPSFIFETRYWLVYLNSDQSYLGRCVVVLKLHKEALSELSNEEWHDFAKVVKKLELAVKASLGATMCNWSSSMNDAYQDHSPHPHVHWHFRPRYKDEVDFEHKVFVDPDFGHHYNRERKDLVSNDLIEKIVARIKEAY